MSRWESILGSRTCFWVLFGVFLGGYGAVLGRLPYTIDEGVNVLYARQMAAGQRPYVDFFYHQFPFQLHLFSWISRFASDSLVPYRLPSLLAVAGTGWVVHRIAQRLLSAPAATIAAALYYCVPLQYHGLLAIPNGPMMFFSGLAVYWILFFDDRRRRVLGSLSLVVAVLVKPLALATIGVIGVVLLCDRRQRGKLLPVAGIVATGGLASWLGLHLASDGYFTSLLTLLLHPDFAQAIYDAWSSFSLVSGEFARRGVDSFLSWNLWMHYESLRDWSTSALVGMAAGGALLVATGRSRLERTHKILLACWFTFPFFFNLFVWKPSFNSYHRQCLPVLCILASLFLCRLWRSRRSTARAAGVALLVAIPALSTLEVALKLRDYGPLRALDLQGQELFTLDPVVNFFTDSTPACGLTDPMARIPLGYASPELAELLKQRSPLTIITQQMMIDCLEASPGTRILISSVRFFPLFFIGPELYEYIERQDESRRIYPTEADRTLLREVFE